MEPSSLVVAGVIAIWVAFVLPSWARSRQQWAQARYGDRFSTGLRVLQRRPQRAKARHSASVPLLRSPRLVRDADGEWLYLPAESNGQSAATREPAPTTERAPLTADLAAPDPTEPEPARPELTLPALRAAAHAAAHRRLVVLGVLAALTALLTVLAALTSAPSTPAWLSGLALVAHLVAGRRAAHRSRARLAALAARSNPRSADRHAVATQPLPPQVPDTVARRRAANVASPRSAPVAPAPTTPPLAPPAASQPIDPTPAAAPAAAATAGRPAASRATMPRRPEDIERILNLDQDYDVPAVVNG